MHACIRGTRSLTVALAVVGLCAGCTDLSSSDIKTSGIHAFVLVEATGNGHSHVSAELHVGESLTDFVELANGDALTATVGSTTQTLDESKLLGVIDYGASFTDQDAPGTKYTVDLERGGGDASAPDSSCTLPAAFALTAPSDSPSFSRANDDIAVAYTGSGESEPITWTASGDCIQITSGSASGDTGSFTIAKGTLKPASSSSDSQPTSCTVTVTVSRTRTGTLDPAYGGGNIRCAQSRNFTITSAP